MTGDGWSAIVHLAAASTASAQGHARSTFQKLWGDYIGT